MKRRIEKLKDRIQKHKDLEVDRDKYFRKASTIPILKDNISNLQDSITIWEQELEALKAKDNPHKVKPLLKKRDKLKAKYKDLSSVVKTLKKEIEIKQWLLNDVLSNKGLKAYIFSTMISYVNRRLLYYSKFIGLRAEISIDMASANKNVVIKVFNGDILANIADLSGGQGQLIDIAISFSIHDLVSADKPCNILFMDEVFESLDPENVELVTDLIKVKAKGLSLFLVSHIPTFHVTSARVIKLIRDENKHTVYE